jgi:hypothetical protein
MPIKPRYFIGASRKYNRLSRAMPSTMRRFFIE